MRHPIPSALVLAWAVSALPAAALTLYDLAAGSLPAAQGWTTRGTGTAAANQSVGSGLLRIDTTASGLAAFGHGRATPQPLDTQAGFQLRWQLQVISEQHSSEHRAGLFSLMQGADQR